MPAMREVAFVKAADIRYQSNLDQWYSAAATRDAEQWMAATAAPPPVVEGTQGAQIPQARASYSGDVGVWDRIAECESGGNWATNTGNGYYGGLQMNMQFWHSYGGDEFASRPDLASREQQIVVAERARDSGRGYRPWPVCGARA